MDLTREETDELVRTIGNPKWRLVNLYRIADKQGRTVIFRHNKVQADIERRWTGRGIILKHRQPGVSTYFMLRSLDRVLWYPNTWACVIAHKRETLDILFSKIQFAWDNLDSELKARIGEPRTDNKNELFWRERNSKIYVALEVQGGTNHIVHFSEYARIDDWRISATLPTIPPNGEIIKESTPAGMGNKFHKEYLLAKRGESADTAFFYEWHWTPEYRYPVADVKDDNLTPTERSLMENHGLDLEQIQWRRVTWKDHQQADGSNLFSQEFVEDDISCFLSSGEAAFDMETLEANRAYITNNPRVYLQGYLYEKDSRILFDENRHGPLKIYDAPERALEYVMGVDISLGDTKGDYQSVQVGRRDTREQVAVYRNRTEVGLFAKDVALLGRYYNRAYVNPERNTIGQAFINDFIDIYPHEKIYQQKEKLNIRVRPATKFGYYSGRRSKEWLITLVQNYLREDGFIYDMETIEEMMQYQRYDLSAAEAGHFGYQAKRKKHDDLIMALGLMLEMDRTLPAFRPQMSKILDVWDRALLAASKAQGNKQRVDWTSY